MGLSQLRRGFGTGQVGTASRSLQSLAPTRACLCAVRSVGRHTLQASLAKTELGWLNCFYNAQRKLCQLICPLLFVVVRTILLMISPSLSLSLSLALNLSPIAVTAAFRLNLNVLANFNTVTAVSKDAQRFWLLRLRTHNCESKTYPKTGTFRPLPTWWCCRREGRRPSGRSESCDETQNPFAALQR